MTGDHDQGAATTDPEAYREMADEIARLTEAAERLRELGGAADVPAVERNAVRVLGVAAALSDNVPEELLEE